MTIKSAGSAAATPEIDPDLPEEIDFSDAVRGKAGRRLFVQWARYRRALQTIATTQRDQDPVRALEEIRASARLALADDAPGPAGT